MRLVKHGFFIFLLLLSKMAGASHISGGELFYQYIGPGAIANTDKYKISVRLFRECNSTGQELSSEIVSIGIFSTQTNTLVSTLVLDNHWLDNPVVIQNTPGAIPCLTGDGSLCYQIALFDGTISLPRTADGYTLSWVRCCRQEVVNIFNTPYADNAQGATFITHIPGTSILPVGSNNSPQFVVKDTVLVCADKPFKLDFSAFDTDGDSLAYTFCEAYIGATLANPRPDPDNVLSLTPLPYLAPYSGAHPLGESVTINPFSGIISGTAPAIPGKYVVNVCVEEYRNGVLLNVHHKDFILKIANCDFASAQLKPSYLTCDGFGLQFENGSTSPLIKSYFWDFGVKGAVGDTSTDARPFFNFPDSGIYKVKLVVNKNGTCGDSATTLAKIYPGFTANFGAAIKCLPDAAAFIDSSSTKYGLVDSWKWDFGDTTGTANIQNPGYTYKTAGIRNITLIVTNSKGCTDSITRQMLVPDKLLLTLAKDTSVCNLDTLKLAITASAQSRYTWLPKTDIVNADSASPLVFPRVKTVYTVSAVDIYGCIAADTVTVNVLALPAVATIPDAAICSSTSIPLTTTSTGNTFSWQPATGLSDSTNISPVAGPLLSTQYIIAAKNADGCIAKDTVNIKVNASPVVKASPDSLICLGGKAQLTAGTPVTATYSWSPSTGLDNPLTANPVASPTATITYQVQVIDSNACKGLDTVVVTVIPAPVFAVTPTNRKICVGDSLLLTASGGDIYRWYPTTNISSDTAATPRVFPKANTTYKVVIISSTCHVTDSVEAVVNVNTSFPLSITKSNDIDCFTGQARLLAHGGTQYTWKANPSLSNTYTSNPVATPVETTTYYVTATNGTACVVKDSIQVKIITDNVQNGYYLASAFSPNGDGVNDCFRVKDWGGIKSVRLSVYNRWGNLVFYSASPSGCWDGTYKGVPQPAGTYVYQVRAETVCGKVYRKGTLVLIR